MSNGNTSTPHPASPATRERDRMVVVAPDRRRPARDYVNGGKPLLTAAEIGRMVMALRGWRRVLARLAGLPVD